MQIKSLKRILSAVLAVLMIVTIAPVSKPQTAYALSDEDITATLELGKGFNLLAGKTFEAGNLQSAPIFKSMENMNPTKTRLGDVESKMTYITSMSSYLDNTHTDVSVDVNVSTEILLAKTDIKAKFGFKGSWESSGSTNKSRLILEILAKAYKYSMNINQGNPWEKGEDGKYVTLNDKFAKDLINMDPKAFFNTYGTHIVTQYDAGGEAYTSYEGTDTSNSAKSEFDIETNAEVGVTTEKIAAVNVAVSASGGEKHENSFANNNQQMSMRVRGGDPMYSTFDKIISGDADATVNAWLASMYGKDENTSSTKSTMIKTDNMQLFAMWDLLAMDKSQSHTARIEQLKKYYMDNVKEEVVDMYQEFIYGIPGNFADEYAQIYSELVTDEELGSIDAIPEGFLPVRTEDDLMRMNGNLNYILLNDIEITDDFIHAAVDYDEFTGIFDGNGHTISGLQLIDTKGKYIGLFPLINEGAVIKNLVIKDAEIVIESDENQTVYAGILCGANTEGLTGSDLGKIMDVRIEDSSITIKGGAGKTYLGGIVGYTDSRNDNNNDRALQRATVKNCVIKNERSGADSAVGGITGYHKGQGGWAMLRVASYDNEISTAEGYAGGVIGRTAYQRGSYVFGAYNTPENGYAGYIENTSNADYTKIFTVGEESFALDADYEIFEQCETWLTADDEAHLWTYTGEWGDLPEPVFATSYPYLIVHAPGGITAFKDATIGTNDIKVYYAIDPADCDTYEDVTDYVNYFYDFSEVGTTTVAAVYGNKTIEFEVEVQEPVVTEANIVNTGKTEYRIGDVFTIDDFVGQLVYSNTFTENVFAANAEFVVTIPELEGSTPVVPGEYVFEETTDCTEVVVMYDDVEFVYEISVAEAEDTGAKINFTANYIPVSADAFKYDIYINNNPGIVALKSTLIYDESAYTLKNIIDKEALAGYTDSTEKDESGANVIYESPVEIFWSDAQTKENNTFNGVILTLEFEYTGGRQSADFYGDKLIKFMFNGAYDVAGNPVGGRNGVFDIANSKVRVGDVNADEKVSIWDAVLLKQSTYNDNYENLFLSAADVNFDYSVNTLDSLFLNRHIVGQYGLTGTPGTYNVTFKGYGFDTYENVMSVGDVLSKPTHPDKYTFAGWYDNPAFEGDPVTHISAVTGSNLTFWAKMLCPVSYFSGIFYDGLDALPRTHSISPENPFNLSAYEISADNYDFLYWTYKFNGTDDEYERVPEGGITEIKGNGELFMRPVFSDVKEYRVYVVVEAPGLFTSTLDKGTYVPGGTIFVPSSGTPDYDGYIKGTGLYLDADYTDGPYKPDTKYTTDATKKEDLYFYFRYEPVEFNVIVDWGVEGVEGETLRYVYGNELKLPNPPNRNGYTFNGWKSTHTTASGSTSTDNIMGDSLPKQWLPYRYVNGMDVTLTAQWSKVSKVKITMIDGLTLSSSVYEFDPTKDYTLPAGSTKLVLVNGEYYKFDGWYDNKDYTGSPVTVISANTFNPEKYKYYSKWTPVTKSEIRVYNKYTNEYICTVYADPGKKYIFPDPSEFATETLKADYVANVFTTLSGSTYSTITEVQADFSYLDVYLDAVARQDSVENIFSVSDYTSSNTKKLGVSYDGLTVAFEPAAQEKEYVIYTSRFKQGKLNLNYNVNNYVGTANVKYRAEYCGNKIGEEKTLRLASKLMGVNPYIYSPAVKDEYKLTLYTATHSYDYSYIYKTGYTIESGEHAGRTGRKWYASTMADLTRPVLDGYPITLTRGEKIQLPVLEDQTVSHLPTYQTIFKNMGLPESEWGNYKLKFLGWFERPFFTQPNEQPITEIDTTLLTGDVQLYAIFEPLVVDVTYDNATYELLDVEFIDTSVKPLGRIVYPLVDSSYEYAYEVDADGNYIKKAPKSNTYSFYPMLDAWTTSYSMQLYHPYGNTAVWYDNTNTNIRDFKPVHSSPVEYYVYAKCNYPLSDFGVPNPAEEN